MQVILVDENDHPVGAMEKMQAHREARLHRAYSVFIFNEEGDMLLQKRAQEKYHSAGLWTNACCSHPSPGSTLIESACRRLQEEMGFTVRLEKLFDFTYRVAYDNGLTEYEFDHVLVGNYNGAVIPNPHEVAEYCFKPVGQIKNELVTNGEAYSEWFKIAFPRIEDYIASIAGNA